MGSSGISHGSGSSYSSSSSTYTPSPSWDQMSPQEKQQELERMHNAEQWAAQRKSDERKRKAKKAGLIVLGVVAGIGLFIGLIAILVKSCS